MLGCTDAKTRRILSYNQTFADKLGYEFDEILGREMYDFYHPDCIEQYNKVFEDESASEAEEEAEEKDELSEN